jgi:uncharacterized protein
MRTSHISAERPTRAGPRAARRGVLSFAVFALVATAAALGQVPAGAMAVDTPVVISQVYGGAQNTGAVLPSDFVELFNRSSDPASLGGLSLQYGSYSGNIGLTTALPAVTLQPGQYYLVKLAGGGLSGSDHTAGIDIGGIRGKIALVEGTAALSCGATTCSPEALERILDLVGYGAWATFYEGSGPVPDLSGALAALRSGDGCVDTNDNASDFTVDAPAPRNSTSPFSPCPTAPAQPTSKDDCKEGSWQAFGFRNQGLCIQFVNTGKDSR